MDSLLGGNMTKVYQLNHCDSCGVWMTPKIGQGTTCQTCMQWKKESIEQAYEALYGDMLAAYAELGSLRVK